MHEELLDLSVLNAVLFEELSASGFPHNRLVTAKFDFTDPKKDGCQVERHWGLRADGDFYLIRMLGSCIYIVVGDATGHSAYAGGLKVFVAAALKTIFQRFEIGNRTPTCGSVVSDLRKYFNYVAAKSRGLGDQARPLQDGADLIVVRFQLNRRRVSFASAGIPVIGVGVENYATYGRFDSTRGIRFPDAADSSLASHPLVGSIDAKKFGFLAIVTDGFRNLKRLPLGSKSKRMDSFGDDATARALMKGANRAKLRSGRQTDQIASSLVESARKFRRNHRIPEMADDNRLVLIIDVDKVLASRARAS